VTARPTRRETATVTLRSAEVCPAVCLGTLCIFHLSKHDQELPHADTKHHGLYKLFHHAVIDFTV